ncbi:MAG: hypothetical protein C0616_08300 [Desulfuromonas sp.]|nr:MAG: hypothetical protein C0616_08300 [Desulfuromonas sp.]
MLNSLKLRWKILLALVSLSVLPLIVTLILMSGFTGKVINDDMLLLAEKTGNFVQRATAQSEQELLNYVSMISSGADVVNATYYATLAADTDQLAEITKKLQQEFGLDYVLALNDKGEVLLQSTLQGDAILIKNAADHPLIKQSLEGQVGKGVNQIGGQFGIMAAAPIRLQDKIVGHFVGANLFNDRFVQGVKELSGADIAFFRGNRAVASSLSALRGFKVGVDETGYLEAADNSYAVFKRTLGETGLDIVIALDRSAELSAKMAMKQQLVMIVFVAAVLAILFGLVISKGVSQPLSAVVGSLKKIAAGGGDLTKQLETVGDDEVGELGTAFNELMGRLREMVSRVRNVAGDLVVANQKIQKSSQQVTESAEAQGTELKESHLGLKLIDDSSSEVADSVSTLVTAVEESSSATLELAITIEEISSQMERLFATVEDVSSSINQMSVSSQEVEENVDILNSSTEVTASSIVELDAAIKEIEDNAEQTSSLAAAATEDAERGSQAVAATLAGIEEIRQSVDVAAKEIENLGTRSKDIGKILTVIDDVADQTSLLALNAAIIAAQAGEHGRGFAVVADEIRELAERTAVSTREIGDIISDLQNGTAGAVKAMQVGMTKVYDEVERSKETGNALQKIRSSTDKAHQQVRTIVRATQEQSRGSRQITESINQVTIMLTQITTAIRQQNDTVRQLARASDAMKEIAAQGKLSTSEQAKGSRQIQGSIDRVRDMIERINSATTEQTHQSKQVLDRVNKVLAIADDNSLSTKELDEVVEDLNKLTSALNDEVGAFTV